MDESLKTIYKRIKRQCNGDESKAIAKTLKELDRYVEKAEINDSFYANYCSKKKILLVHSTITPNLLLGTYVSIFASFAVNELSNGKLVNYIIICFFGLLISYISTIKLLTTVPLTVLYPYVVSKMEEKIKNSN